MDPSFSTSISFDGAVQLGHGGVIRAVGEDAAGFLNSQLSNDFARLGLDRGLLAAYCSPKGRMLASFVALRRKPQETSQEVWLATDAELLAPTLKRLGMFVLRAKVKLSDASADLKLVGLTGATAATVSGEAASLLVWGKQDLGAASLLRLPDAGLASGPCPRWLWIGPAAEAESLLASQATLPLAHWQWLEVMSGVAMINAATVEQFVPQMLNYELVGGVDFQKGCYPGQEIVARSQYRGSIKRRTVLVHAEAELKPGVEVYWSLDAGQPAGLVAQAAHKPLGGGSALVEIKLAALEAGSLHLGSPEGPRLTLGHLPYNLPMDTAAEA
ncbi:MAG TPA: folate-binding protein [Methylibium sp.]